MPKKIPRQRPLSLGEKKKRDRLYRIQNREIRNIKLSVWRIKNPELVSKSHRKTYFKVNYGIIPEEAEKMLKYQDGKCAICKNSTFLGGKQGAKVDHCHTADNIRGILCNSCNIGLGHFKDNISILLNAINYLKKRKFILLISPFEEIGVSG